MLVPDGGGQGVEDALRGHCTAGDVVGECDDQVSSHVACEHCKHHIENRTSVWYMYICKRECEFC